MPNTQSDMEDISLTMQNTFLEPYTEQRPVHTLPLVSFIIAYYNTPVEWLRECIDSIIALPLTQDEREIIIVDDGSETSIENDLNVYSGSITYIRQQNGGPGSARNTGLDNAKGEYIQFVDSDDKLDSAEYAKCIEIIECTNTDILLFDFQDGSERYHVHPSNRYTDGCDYMIKNNIMGMPWWYVFKRSILKDIRFTTNIYHEDEEFNPLLMLNSNSLFSARIKAYIYRKHPDSITKTKDIAKITKRLNDKHWVINRLKVTCNKFPERKREALERRIAQLTMDYIWDVIVETKSSKQLSTRIKQLSSEGLFPLPNRPYTQKYVWFRRISNYRVGRWFMLMILPLLKQ